MRQNPYRGINAHLNSLLQQSGTSEQPALWSSFHGRHIAYICDALNDLLPSHYIAFSEQSLQTRTFDFSGTVEVRRPEPDVSVFQRTTGTLLAEHRIPKPSWTADMASLFEPLKHPSAIVIRAVDAQKTLGRIVTRIELLSPSNKPSGNHYQAYADKRLETLQIGTPLIEIDYLHETPPPLMHMPQYGTHSEATPYCLVISDPRPTWEEGKIMVYGFGIDEIIPSLYVPLADKDFVVLELNAVYQHTFTAGRWGDLLNYTMPPLNIDRYSLSDQKHIAQVIEK
jgi:hypothetical protein